LFRLSCLLKVLDFDSDLNKLSIIASYESCKILGFILWILFCLVDVDIFFLLNLIQVLGLSLDSQ